MEFTTITIIGATFLGLALGFGINAILIYVIIWGLKAIGITTICGWTICFSWPLVIVFTLVILILRSIFSVSTK